jgi:hypothetical protein
MSTAPTTTSLTDSTVELRVQLRAQLGDALEPFEAEADELATRDLGAGAPAVGSRANCARSQARS